MSITEPNPRQSARRAVAALAILATIALLLANGTTAAAETPQILSGRYDSYYRAAETGQILQNTRRLVVIDVLKLGIKVTSYLDGKLQGSRFLVKKCNPTYDPKLGSYYQNFETTPSNGSPVERVQFGFRTNASGNIANGTYDVYYQQPDNSKLSEILDRQQ